MGFLDKIFGKKEEIIDDLSYIAQMKHLTAGPWHQYDFLLAASGYGWDYMVDAADYMTQVDLDRISTITKNDTELIDEYRAAGDSIKNMKSLSDESGALAIGGISKTIGLPVKIVWLNQTKVIRIFTLSKDEDLLTRYAETLIRRSFGTKDAMKKAKPAK